MIPILYKSTETAFATQGIGAMKDALSCTVTEERNGVYELEMTYPTSGALFSEIKDDRLILAKPSETAQTQPFRIYKLTRPIKGQVTIKAEHISYVLSGIPVKPFTATGAVSALQGLKDNSMVSCPFEVWTDIENTASEFSVNVPQSFRASLGGVQGSFLDVFGSRGSCEFEWDRWTVKAHQHRGSDNGVYIEYGKNLIDLKQEESIESTYTGAVAYWRSADGTETISGAVQYAEDHAAFAHERIYILDASSEFEQEPTADELNAMAAEYVVDNDLGVPTVNLTVNFVALWQTKQYEWLSALERVSLCDTVTVKYFGLGVDAKAEVIKTEYDALKERYIEITLGDAKSTMSDTIRQTVAGDIRQYEDATRSALQQAVDHSTSLITGGLGGHVIINTNADGKPNEILIMDTDDKATAVNVIRMNEGGIAFSQSGYNGPFTTAWTIDSRFVADFIMAGTLDANLLRAGIIMDSGGYSWWNLETGELHIGSKDGGASASSLWEQINSNTAGITNLQSGVTIGTDTVTIGRSDSHIKSVFGNSALLFVDTSGNRIAWLSTDDGLGAGSLSIGSETNSAQRWRIVPWGDGKTHLKIFKHN